MVCVTADTGTEAVIVPAEAPKVYAVTIAEPPLEISPLIQRIA